MLNPYVWLAVLALLAGSYGTGRWHQYRSDLKDQAEAKFTESESARLRERAAQVSAQRIADEKEAANRDRVGRLAAELERMRKRADRLPEASRAACAGATGAELAAPDGGFLARYGAYARSIQLELEACQQREAVSQ
jgi:hypothetical protein